MLRIKRKEFSFITNQVAKITGYLKLLIFLLSFLPMHSTLSAQLPPGINDNELYKNGYLDVTLFGADSTGVLISTEAIQTAVNVARDNDLVCYFPSGTYLVDDTIKCMKKSYWDGERWQEERHYCVLVGSGIKRPVIKLLPGSPAFQNPDKPIPVFWFWSMYYFAGRGPAPCMDGSTDPICNEANINYNQSFRSINIDLGGNPGAIGIKHAAAQGSSIEDVKINAVGAFAGLHNPTGGVAGGTFNIEVEGGKYGIYYVGREFHLGGYVNQSNFPTLAGCVFKNQEIAVFHLDLINPMVLTGFHIVMDKGVFNDVLRTPGMNLIDGVIEMNGGQLINNTSGSNVYISNLYIKGAESITGNWPVSDNKKWVRVDEYSFCNTNSFNLVNGTMNKTEYKSKTENLEIDTEKLAHELIGRHIWDQKAFPCFESAGVVNIKDASLMNGSPATGDGIADDTEALEYAIANHTDIFLPKGNYKISKTLILGKNTRLFGTHRTYTRITGAGIQTVNDTEANTSLAFLSCGTLNWKAGRNSFARSISPGRITITENGGGKWYAIFNVGSQTQINGTSQPLSIYGFNPERAADPQAEIRDAKNVRLYTVKTESGVSGRGNSGSHSTSVRIINSSNIGVFTCTGNVTLSNNMALVEVINSSDVIVTHVESTKTPTDWSSLKEIVPGNEEIPTVKASLGTFIRGSAKPHY